MATLFARQAPDFSATTVMPDDRCQTIGLSDYRGKYVVWLFCSKDFTSSPSNRPAPVSGL